VVAEQLRRERGHGEGHRDHHRDRDLPVVADDEVVPELAE
jgi:hypothetical protein